MDSRMKKVISLCVQVILWFASVIINAPPGWFSAANWIISQMFHILFHSFCVFVEVSDSAWWQMPSLCLGPPACVCVTMWSCSSRITASPLDLHSTTAMRFVWSPEKNELMCLRLLKLFAQDWTRWDNTSLRFLFQLPYFLSIRDEHVRCRAGNGGKIGILIF